MAKFELPAGTYFSLTNRLRPNAGGLPRALLMRNRLFAQYTAIRPILLTVDTAPVYPDVRKSLRDAGQLIPGMKLLNLYEDLRNTDLSSEPATRASADMPDGLEPITQAHPDGSTYCTHYLRAVDRVLQFTDYHRPDGSRYLRIPVSEEMKARDRFFILNENDEPVRAYRTIGDVYRFWLRWLAPAGRVFVFSEDRYVLSDIVPFRSPRIHVLHTMHNVHTGGRPAGWNASFAPGYGPLLEGLSDLDALITLTERQQSDVIKRFGRTNNLFVVPNPVEIPSRSLSQAPRRPRHFVTVARLERQKRLEDAIEIFSRVLKRVPDATFDIYGKGTLRSTLQRRIDDLGIGHAVRLRGYDPTAREAASAAAAFLMTSRYEGYPLATLEAMSHGCPVISYDIRYGPRDQITDGVDGYLVPAGDKNRFADRIVEFCQDPNLTARMSEAAYKKADLHDYKAVLARWQGVLTTVAQQKRSRVDITAVKLSDERTDYAPLVGRAPRTVGASSGRSRTLTMSGQLDIAITGDKQNLAASDIEVHAICDETAAMFSVPSTFTREGATIRYEVTVDPEEVFKGLGKNATSARVRLTYTCANFSWRADLGRRGRQRGEYEISFTPENRLVLAYLPA